MANANHDNVDELISRHLAGETAADDETRLLQWINRSEENKRYYFRLKKAFDLASRHVQIPVSDNLDVDVDREWDHFRQKAGARDNVVTLSRSAIWLRVAASLLFILATGAILYFFTRPDSAVVRTAANTETFSLPDGSQVTLNRYSQLSYGPDFNDRERTVVLDGEAFFDVTPDANKPFVITSGSARVHVVGTSFNVNAYDSLDFVEVIVETGIVRIEPVRGSKEPVDVLPGEKAIISKSDQRISVAVNQDVNFRAWSTLHLVFVDNDLMSVIRTLERTFNAAISVNTDIPPSCVVTVTFDKQSLESVMMVLANTLNLKYTINGNKVEITEAGC